MQLSALTLGLPEFDPEEEIVENGSANGDHSDDGDLATNAAREHYLDVGCVFRDFDLCILVHKSSRDLWLN